MKINQFLLLGIISLLLLGSSCFVIQNKFDSLAPGYWRAILKLDPENPEAYQTEKGVPLRVEELVEGDLPFIFELVYDNEKDFHLEIINGEERIKVTDITIGRDRVRGQDTIVIKFPFYDSYVKGIYEENLIEGKWYVPNRGDYNIPFRAKHGQKQRFSSLKKTPKIDLTGKWETTFSVDTDEPYPAIGEFKQDGNHISGTFLTETGDYRFLEGTIQANKIYLSCFDGAHAFLFEAKILDDETLIGSFRSGSHYRTTWSAKKNPKVTLADPDSLTYLKEGYSKLEFSFPNTEGKMVSLTDEVYEGKVKIVQIFGTWCPNCKDETSFLAQYLKDNPTEDLKLIALAFEKYKGQEKALATLKNYKTTFGVDYEMLLAGYYDKAEAAKSLPMLNHILSYPTMIFIDKKGEIRRIHTGFSGPATSTYPAFKKDFEQFVATLLAE
ncbi:MAG: TlpA disulfide reductase family protein [Saprospiraceae bacterium]